MLSMIRSLSVRCALSSLVALAACVSDAEPAATAPAVQGTAGTAGSSGAGGSVAAAGEGGAAGVGGAAGAAGGVMDTHLVDARDGKSYPTVTVGKQRWMAKNLAYAAPSDSYCYGDDPAACESHGRLYGWSVAPTACPAAWHLPTDDEWKVLESTLGMSTVDVAMSGYDTARGTDEGTKLKLGGTSGFDALLAGFRTGTTYEAMGDRSYFWTASTAPGQQVWRRRVVGSEATIFRFANPTATFAITIRCVAD